LTDTPLRWTNTVSYYLPFGKGKMLLANANKWTDLAVGGWQVNFTNVYQTGFPLAIYQSTNNNSILGSGVQRPNATGVSPEVSGSVESRLNGYINPAAFASAASYTYGNLARTIPYRGPGMKNWDISLFKNFAITERFNAEFRAEALNAFNSPQFPNPNTRYGSASFGTITSQVNFSRLLQLGVRFYF
jgi:trimeric autotransporter adhesin